MRNIKPTGYVLTDHDLYYLKSIQRQMDASALIDSDKGLTLANEVAADNRDWLDSFIDTAERRLLTLGSRDGDGPRVDAMLTSLLGDVSISFPTQSLQRQGDEEYWRDIMQRALEASRRATAESPL